MAEENDFFIICREICQDWNPISQDFVDGVFQNFYNLVVWGAFAIVLKKCQQIRSLMRMVIRVIKIKPVGSTLHCVIYSNFPK